MASLTLSNLGLAVGDQTILSEIGLWVAAGEFVALPGPSGGGRSKLLRPVARFERSTTGTISPDGQAVAGPGRHPPPGARRIVTMAPRAAPEPRLTVEIPRAAALPPDPRLILRDGWVIGLALAG